MHVHTLRKPVRPAASLQKEKWRNAGVVEMQKNSSPLEVSVDTPNIFCLFSLLLILLLQTALSVV